MNFKMLVENLLRESPDSLEYEGNVLTFQNEKGDPQTFFITNVSTRIDARKGYKADIDSPLGMCIVHGPSKTSSSPGDNIRVNYYEDTDTPELTHANFASFLIHNKEYSYEELKKLGIVVYSFKKDVDSYFEQFKDAYPKITFTLAKDNEEIGLEYRGRFWMVDNKAIVSLWHFNKDNCMKYIIPFFKNKFGIDEDNVVFEVATYEENETKEGGTGKYVSGSGLREKTINQKPYEKDISTLLAKLHSTPAGEQKEKTKNELKELLLKHGLDPKMYGLTNDVPKASEFFAQKMLGGTKNNTIASLKARQQTSESVC
jgi:hypothetical protein